VVIKEKNREFLYDKDCLQPRKSLFNIGDYRHHKTIRESSVESNNKMPVDTVPQRFL
jgi:hypothetical protein